jgi:hypothetical protein
VKSSLKVQAMTEAEFVAHLRRSTEQYLASMDAWEAQYQRFYRLSSRGASDESPDTELLHRDFLDARRAFQGCVPRARQLCRRHGLRDPWQALLHIHLGANAPQAVATTSALGRAERTLIMDCLTALATASSPAAPSAEPTPNPISKSDPAPRRRGIFGRVYDYFF